MASRRRAINCRLRTSAAGPEAVAVLAAAGGGAGRRVLQRRAWQWALANRRPDGSLPAGSEVARQFGRSERWGRLVTGPGRAVRRCHRDDDNAVTAARWRTRCLLAWPTQRRHIGRTRSVTVIKRQAIYVVAMCPAGGCVA